MEHILYWLWLTTKYGVTPSKIKVLLEYFKTVEEIYFSKNGGILPLVISWKSPL